jgi:2-aminoethylphosphonate-pyruvate transaminase
VPADGGLLVVDNGVYGDRLLRIARAHGIAHRALSYDVAAPARPEDVRTALRADPRLTHVAVVHHETTTGVLNPIAGIVRASAGEGRRVLVDAMSSLFGEPLDVTQDGIDFVMASANKCLQGVPGVSFVLARRQALDALREVPPRSVYLDLGNHYRTQEQDNTPFTPAVQVLHAMRQALRELEKEEYPSGSRATRRTRASCAAAWPRSASRSSCPRARARASSRRSSSCRVSRTTRSTTP